MRERERERGKEGGRLKKESNFNESTSF